MSGLALGWVWQWTPEALVRRFPALAKWRRQLAESHADAAAACAEQDTPAAIAHLAKAVALEPKDLDYIFDLGRLYFEQNDLTNARDCFQRALGIDFFNAAALKGLGYTLHLSGELDDAVYCYLKYLQQYPDDTDVHANLIEALASLGKYEDAAAAAEQACEAFPQDATFPFLAGKNSFDAGNVEKAIAHVRRAEELDPARSEIEAFMGSLLASTGDLDQAMLKFKKAIALNPENAGAYLEMATLLNATDRDAEYLDAAQKAREICAAQANEIGLKRAYWDEGWANCKLRRWPEAIAASENALRIDGTLASVRFNLGLALLHVADVARATEEYQKGIELEDIGALKTDAIDDLEDALKDHPNLAGAKAILDKLHAAYAHATSDRASRTAA